MGITYTSSGAFKTKQKLSNFEQKIPDSDIYIRNGKICSIF